MNCVWPAVDQSMLKLRIAIESVAIFFLLLYSVLLYSLCVWMGSGLSVKQRIALPEKSKEATAKKKLNQILYIFFRTTYINNENQIH